MNDEYAGNSGETEKSQESESQSSSGSDSSSKRKSTTSDKKDTGNYKDGNYSINGQYGPVGEDSIDVHLTIKDGNVETVNIIGHPFTTISKNHQDDFAKAINGVVDGKPLKGLKVDKVAGASWTSDASTKPSKSPARRLRFRSKTATSAMLATADRPCARPRRCRRPLLCPRWLIRHQRSDNRGQQQLLVNVLAKHALRDSLLEERPHTLQPRGHHLVDDVLEELGLAGQYNAHALDVDVVVAHPIDQSLQ